MDWKRISEELPPASGGSILLYSEVMGNDPDFPGHPYHVSNPHYARVHYYAQSPWTHWAWIMGPE